MEQQLSVSNRVQATSEIIEAYRTKATSWRCLCLEVGERLGQERF